MINRGQKGPKVNVGKIGKIWHLLFKVGGLGGPKFTRSARLIFDLGRGWEDGGRGGFHLGILRLGVSIQELVSSME